MNLTELSAFAAYVLMRQHGARPNSTPRLNWTSVTLWTLVTTTAGCASHCLRSMCWAAAAAPTIGICARSATRGFSECTTTLRSRHIRASTTGRTATSSKVRFYGS